MSRRNRYPEIIFQFLKSKRSRQCQVIDCKNPAEFRIEIRQTHMRGDDDVFWFCKSHRVLVTDDDASVSEQCTSVYKMTGNYYEDS